MSSSHVPEPPAFVQLAAHPLRWQLLTALVESDYRVRELVSLLEQPQNLLSYHLRLLRDGGLVSASRSSYDGRDSYYHLDLDRCAHALAETGAALHPALRRPRRHPRGPPGDSAAGLPPCSSCAPATASAHPSLKPCCDTTAPASVTRDQRRHPTPSSAAPTHGACPASSSSASTSPPSTPGTSPRWPGAGSTTWSRSATEPARPAPSSPTRRAGPTGASATPPRPAARPAPATPPSSRSLWTSTSASGTFSRP